MPFENLLPTSRQKIMLDQGDKHMESSSDPEEGRPDTERLAEEIRKLKDRPDSKRLAEEIRKVKDSPDAERLAEEIRTFEDRPDWKRLVDEIRKIFGFE